MTKPKLMNKRALDYFKQNGCPRLTPKQQRRANKKNRRIIKRQQPEVVFAEGQNA